MKLPNINNNNNSNHFIEYLREKILKIYHALTKINIRYCVSGGQMLHIHNELEFHSVRKRYLCRKI